MKAIVLRELGGPKQLQFEDVSIPEPGPKEVLVRLKNAALNRRDVFITYGQYPGIELPAIPGSDGAGEVVAVGTEVESTAPGEAVVINPGMNWGNDIHKKSAAFQILGVPSDGTYAQYVKVPAENVFSKPEHLSWEEAAALPLAGVTAYRAVVTKGQVKEGEHVFVPGVGGGVATFLVQFAAALGAKVYVSSSKDEKIEKAKQFGAVDGVNYSEDGWSKTLKKMTGGIDLSIDSIGGDVFEKLLSLGNNGSRIVSFGATRGPVPKLVIPKLFLKDITLYGTAMGSPQEFRQMLALVTKHEIRPVLDKTYALEDAAEAQTRMENGENFGKIVLEIPED
ncbi:MAG TPA: zinc-binding dehydrogenase [Bacillales bacterium]|nr:zinc-binding dehydrogenase [Bacillales bacterium]